MKHAILKRFRQVCYQDNVAYERFKDLTRKTTCNRVLRVTKFNIANNLKINGYQREFTSWLKNF